MKPVLVSEKGQVTIPKPIRDRLGLAPGTAIEFREDGGRLIGRKVTAQEDPVLAVTGILKPADIDRYLEQARGTAP